MVRDPSRQLGHRHRLMAVDDTVAGSGARCVAVTDGPLLAGCGAGDKGFGEPAHGGDHRLIPAPGYRVRGERHTRGDRVDHSLHQHGHAGRVERSDVELTSLRRDVLEFERAGADRISTHVIGSLNQSGIGRLRVETVYDEDRAVLKVIILGDLAPTAELLRLINLMTAP